MEKVIAWCVENVLVLVAVIIGVVAYSFIQAGVTVLRDMFLVRFFKKKANGNTNNGGMTHQQGEELIKQMKSNGETQAAMKTAIVAMNGKVGEMHEATMTKDGDGVTRIGNAFRRVHDLYKKAMQGGPG